MKVRYSSIALLQTGILLLSLSSITVVGWLYGLGPLLGEMQIYPTGIPWLQSESACVATGRQWQDEVCWDSEHDPNF